MATTVLAIVSDLHSNSTVALCPPVVTLDDGGTYKANEQQRWIWRKWRSYWQQVADARAAHDARLIVVLNGELADDNYHATTQLVTRNPADMVRLAIECLTPMLELKPDAIFVARGTEAHSGVSGWLDERIADDIGARPSRAGTASHWQLRLSVEGVRVDVAHHPPGGGGRLPWTRGNFAPRLAAQALMDAASRGERPPHLYVRGHVHAPADSHDTHPVRAIVLPSWQLTTSYGHRLGGGVLPVGGLIVTCSEGGYQATKVYSHWPIEGYAEVDYE